MTHDEMVNLIRPAVVNAGGVWADFGSGRGNFTRALRQLIGKTGVIYAIDKDEKALRELEKSPGGEGELHCIVADFTHEFPLPPLDGIVMANALHFIRDQVTVMKRINMLLKPGGRLILVEYDVRLPGGITPYPVPFDKFESLAREAGFSRIGKAGERKSPTTFTTMYSGVVVK